MPKPIKSEEEKMIAISFRLQPDLFQRLKDRAGSVPISVIIRVLVEKWLTGEIDVDFLKK